MLKYKLQALLACGALAIGTQSAHALSNEVIVGFHSASAGNDYLINLGNVSTIGIGGASVYDLSSLYNATTFNTTFGGSAAGVSFGAGGGQGGLSPNTYVTLNRAGGPGDAAIAGSSAPTLNNSNSSTAANALNGVINASGLAAGQGGILSTGQSGGWTGATVGPTSTLGLLALDINVPLSGGVGYADLWTKIGSGGAYTYQGYLTFDYSGGTLEFTPLTVVPEPSTYALLIAGGMLLFFLRRRVQPGNA